MEGGKRGKFLITPDQQIMMKSIEKACMLLNIDEMLLNIDHEESIEKQHEDAP